MVKRMTFWEIFLAASLIVIGCACGLAVAKEKLNLKYLPVDHDIEMVSQNNTSTPIILTETKGTPAIQALILGHTRCGTCREYDRYNASQCPDCCLYNNNASIHCQPGDPDCRDPGDRPFETACVNCLDTFTKGCAPCPAPCAPGTITPCQKKGCPDTAAPNLASCKASGSVWYCEKDDVLPRKACASTSITHCTAFAATNDPEDAYDIDPVNDINCDPAASPMSTGHCWKYTVKPAFQTCIDTCVAEANQWEHDKLEYLNATYGKKICPQGDCNSGFGDGSTHKNCDPGVCQKKIDEKCYTDYTKDKCSTIEEDYREFLLGSITDHFVEIDPGFVYKFVARSGEKYMVGWQVLCDVIKGDSKYNLYTMIKIVDQDNPGTPVYESIVHQKSLGSTFFINAQTGFPGSADEAKLKAGHSYVIKLYYFLPYDGQTSLQVNVSVMQMILYRTKN